MNLEDQLRNHFEAKGGTLDVPLVEIHLIPHPERSTDRRWTALAAVALAAIALFGFSQFSDTLRDPQQAPIAAPLPELGSISQTVPDDVALPVELAWTKVLDEGGLQIVTYQDKIYGFPNTRIPGASEFVWATEDGATWTSLGRRADGDSWIVASGERLIAVRWSGTRFSEAPAVMETSTDGATWETLPTPGDGLLPQFAGFDENQFVAGFIEDPSMQDVKAALPAPYSDDANVIADLQGTRVIVRLASINTPVAIFATDELGIEPQANFESRVLSIWTTDDFTNWSELPTPEITNFSSVTNAVSGELVFVNWANEQELWIMRDQKLEHVELDFRASFIAGSPGAWVATTGGQQLFLSDDLRSWKQLLLPEGVLGFNVRRGGLGVAAIESNRGGFDFSPPEPSSIYQVGNVELMFDFNEGVIELLVDSEWQYEIRTYSNTPSSHLLYEDGLISFLDVDDENVILTVAAGELALPLFDQLAPPRVLGITAHFSTGDSAWSSADLSALGADGWPIETIITDDFILVSFGDSVWMGTLKE